MDWNAFRSPRMKALMEDGMSMGDASKIVSKEWKAYKEKKGDCTSSKRTRSGTVKTRTGISIKYVSGVSGELSEEQAKDIALGLIDGLLEYADAEAGTELRTMQRRARELFAGEERTASDTAEHRLGEDLAEFLVLAVIDRNIQWSQLEPSVLGGKAAPVMPTFTAPSGSPTKITPAQELGIVPKPTSPSLGQQVGKTALQKTIEGLTKIITS